MEQKRMQEAKMNKTYPAGMKWTKQRKAVYDILEQANEPLSAVQIYNRLEKIAETHEITDMYSYIGLREK